MYNTCTSYYIKSLFPLRLRVALHLNAFKRASYSANAVNAIWRAAVVEISLNTVVVATWQAAPSSFPNAHKSIVVSEYCTSLHYHRCVEFVDPNTGVYPTTRRLGLAVVNQSYAVSHHYRACHARMHIPAPCSEMLKNTVVDDTVLRYRQELVENVRRMLTTQFNSSSSSSTISGKTTSKNATIS